MNAQETGSYRQRRPARGTERARPDPGLREPIQHRSTDRDQAIEPSVGWSQFGPSCRGHFKLTLRAAPPAGDFTACGRSTRALQVKVMARGGLAIHFPRLAMPLCHRRFSGPPKPCVRSCPRMRGSARRARSRPGCSTWCVGSGQQGIERNRLWERSLWRLIRYQGRMSIRGSRSCA